MDATAGSESLTTLRPELGVGESGSTPLPFLGGDVADIFFGPGEVSQAMVDTPPGASQVTA